MLQQMSSNEEMKKRINNFRNLIMSSNNWYWTMVQRCFTDWKEVKNDRPMTGIEYIKDLLEGHHQRCHDAFRMNTESFLVLCNEVKQKGIITESEVTLEEQVGMFLQVVAHSTTMRKIGEDYQHSTETVWRCFNTVLRSILLMQSDYIKLPSSHAPIHPKVSEGTLHAPFKV